jgi:thioredoxin-related protein
MKNRLLILVMVLLVKGALAQKAAVDTPPYKRFPTVPPINILQVDSTPLTKENLKHQATLIMYFSPDCDHCKHQWADMRKRMDQLKKYQIVMITHQPFEQMKDFYRDQKIADYPNVKMGQDGKFMLPPFYRIQSLPYQALYDKSWKLITTFEGNVAVDKLLKAFGK